MGCSGSISADPVVSRTNQLNPGKAPSSSGTLIPSSPPCRSSFSEASMSRHIDALNRRDKSESDQVIRLLIVGPPSSGKSTFLRCMKLLYGQNNEKEFDLEQRLTHRKTINMIVIQGTRAVLRAVGAMKQAWAYPFVQAFPCEDVDYSITWENMHAVKAVWAHPQVTAAVIAQPGLMDANLEYFVADLDRISAVDYLPDTGDCLRSMAPSFRAGVIVDRLQIEKVTFEFTEVRQSYKEASLKTWAPHFDHVLAVVFVASMLDALDPMKRTETARMFKSFREVYRRHPFFLLLNKDDVFMNLLDKNPALTSLLAPKMSISKPSGLPFWANQQNDVAAAIRRIFLAGILGGDSKGSYGEVYTQALNSTSQHAVEIIWAGCKDIILRKGLLACGFLPELGPQHD